MKLVKIISLIMVAAIGFVGFASCGGQEGSKTGALTYVSLRINPEIELVADEDGNVVAANAINEDGEVVLADLVLVGKTVAEAGESFTDKAVELGYLDLDSEGATVYTNVESTDADAAEKVKAGLADRINRYFDNNGIYGRVSAETLDAYAGQAAEWNVSAGHAKMILRVLDISPEMTAEEVLAMSVSERIEYMKNNAGQNGISAELREAHKAEVAALKEEYSELFSLKKEIDALKESFGTEELTDEVKTAIEAEIAEKEAQALALYKEYKEKLDALRSNFKEQSKEARANHKKAQEERKAEFKERVKAHKENFEKNKQKIKERVKQWREKRAGA